MAGELFNINVIYSPSTPETVLVSVADFAGISGGFKYIQDTVPTPTRIGETFFDISTGVTSGNAYVAIDNGSGGLIWVQFSPGSGVLNPTPWTNVSFQNSWVNFGGTLQPAQYRKIEDVTHVRGVVKSGANGTVAFTLPVGFRPLVNTQMAITGYNSSPIAGLVEVNTIGEVYLFCSSTLQVVTAFSFSTIA